MTLSVLPDDVNQDPQLDEPAHHSHPPVPHQHLARGLVLKEEVRQGAGDLVLHLFSPADPQTGGSSPVASIAYMYIKEKAEKKCPSFSHSESVPWLRACRDTPLLTSDTLHEMK